jgi:hypothetical protein
VLNGAPPGQYFDFGCNSNYVQHMQVKSNVQEAKRLTLKEYRTQRLPMSESTEITTSVTCQTDESYVLGST